MDAKISGLNNKKLISTSPIIIPSSKSHTIRALLIAAFAEGESRLLNPLDSADARSCIDACRNFGAEINTSLKTEDGVQLWSITGNGGEIPLQSGTIDTGNSGTTLYLAAGFAANSAAETIFTGDEQIRRRPVRALVNSLCDLGASAEINGDCPPFKIRGPLKGGSTSIECPTSQYLSSLLLCTPLSAAGTRSTVDVPLLMEKPYVEMTLRWLDQQGIEYENDNFRRFIIPGGQRYHRFETSIPGDFSSAAFPLCAAAVTGSKLTLSGLDITDSQGDKAIIDYLHLMGCEFEISPGSITITGPEKLGAADIDLNNTPDALPAMAVASCFADGTSRLYNVPQARLKETDRINVMRQELSKLGADVKELDDGLLIKGGIPLKGCRLNGHGDHRVVMALSVAALGAEGETLIPDSEVVDITYPGFFKMLEDLV